MTIASQNIDLKTGRLQVWVDESTDYQLADICNFAARINPKRGFLFVSTILGRHIPVSPAKMQRSYQLLADKLGDLPKPVLFFGFAETAIGLGHGVYREWTRKYGDALFCHSTRYPFNRPLLAEFQEKHSHAPGHFIYQSADPAIQKQLPQVQTLVLIDDEASTGATLHNARQALAPHLPALQQTHNVVLTHWGGDKAVIEPIHYLLKGRYQFTSSMNPSQINMPKVIGKRTARDQLLPRNDGRFFLSRPMQLTAAEQARLDAQAGQKIAVIGTGEFVTVPFLVAEYLAQQGAIVDCVATSRSPIFIGHAIQHKQEFMDPYGDQIVNFIHNLQPDHYDRILLCLESPHSATPITQLGQLAVEPIYLG